MITLATLFKTAVCLFSNRRLAAAAASVFITLTIFDTIATAFLSAPHGPVQMSTAKAAQCA